MVDVFIKDGVIQWDGDNLGLVSGDEAIKQEAYLRLLTDLSENEFYTDYGSKIGAYIAQAFTEQAVKNVEAETRSALLKVSGITTVLDVTYQIQTVNGINNKILTVQYQTTDGSVISNNYNFGV
jgi:phage baseplate assembly protein W